MNKTVLGTILGATLLALAKNRGSMARIFRDSDKLQERYKHFNGHTFNDMVWALTENILEISLSEDFYKIESIPDQAFMGVWTLNENLKLKNLAGEELSLDIFVTKKDRLSHKLDSKSQEEYDENSRVSNEYFFEYLQEIFTDIQNDIYPDPRDLSQRIFDFLITGAATHNFEGTIYKDSYINIGIINLDERNLHLYQTLMSVPEYKEEMENRLYEILEHEFYHIVDPELFKRMKQGKPTSGVIETQSGAKQYFNLKVELNTNANDFVADILASFYNQSDFSQDEILDYIRNEDYAGLLRISSVFRNRFKAEESGQFSREYNHLADNIDQYTPEQITQELNRMIRQSPYFDTRFFKHWMKMLETAFEDRGLL